MASVCVLVVRKSRLVVSKMSEGDKDREEEDVCCFCFCCLLIKR